MALRRHKLHPLIEAVTGKPYHKIVRQRILKLLGMANTCLHCLEAPITQTAHRYEPARCFTDLGKKNVGKKAIADSTDFHSLDWAVGGLISTAQDLTLFGRALFNDPATLDIMLEPVASPMRVEQVLQHETYDSGCALGVQVGEDGMWHIGGNFGYSSLFYYLPQRDAVLVASPPVTSVRSA